MNAWMKRTMKVNTLSIIVLSASALVLAACGGTPEETKPVENPARPTPTPVSTPTAPPPPTPTAEVHARVPITEWDLDLVESTGRDLEALLPDSERICIQEALGDQYENFLNTPLATLVDEQTDKDALLGCWGQESVAGIALAVFADAAGGSFEPETRTCLADVYRNAPDVVAALVRDGGAAPEGSTFSFDMISCLTPEEAAALTPEDEGPPPDVDGLRCLRAELTNLEGGHEVMDIISSGDPAGLTQEQSALLGVAVEACGIETDFTFPDG